MKNMKRLFLLTTGIFLLLSCENKPTNKINNSNSLNTASSNRANEWVVFSSNGFTFQYPPLAKHKIDRKDGSIAFSTNTAPSFQHIAGDFFIEVYDLSPSPHCEDIGVSSPVIAENPEQKVRTIWGKVDTVSDGSYPQPNCLVKSIYPDKNPSQYQASYALCSEKNEKMVFICIMQVTDDPELAERIFKTFRWME